VYLKSKLSVSWWWRTDLSFTVFKTKKHPMLLGFHGGKLILRRKQKKSIQWNESVTYNVWRYFGREKHLHVAYSEMFCWILHSFIASLMIHLFGATFATQQTSWVGPFKPFMLCLCTTNLPNLIKYSILIFKNPNNHITSTLKLFILTHLKIISWYEIQVLTHLQWSSIL